jgi:hypothetical protein
MTLSGDEEHCLLERDTFYSGRSLVPFLSSVLLPASGLKSTPKKNSSILLRNIDNYEITQGHTR